MEFDRSQAEGSFYSEVKPSIFKRVWRFVFGGQVVKSQSPPIAVTSQLAFLPPEPERSCADDKHPQKRYVAVRHECVGSDQSPPPSARNHQIQTIARWVCDKCKEYGADAPQGLHVIEFGKLIPFKMSEKDWASNRQYGEFCNGKHIQP